MNTSKPLGPNDALETGVGDCPGIRGAILITLEGEVLAQAGRFADEMTTLVPFASGMGDLAARVLEDAGAGQLEFHIAHGSAGTFVVHRVDDDRSLVALADEQTRLGTLIHDLGLMCRRLRKLGKENQRWTQ